MKKYFSLLILALLTSSFLRATTDSQVVIYPESRYGKVLQYLIYDLKLSAGSISSATKASRFFEEYDMNGVRISIYGNESHPYHPEAGTVLYDETEQSGYYKLVRSVKYAQEARGDKDFVVFASKKLNGTSTWPEWVLTDGVGPTIETEEYATMLYDYISFMDSVGIPIDVLGLDNEERWNKAEIDPEQYKDIIDQLTIKLNAGGYALPTWLGYDDYHPNLRDWVETLMNNGWKDYMQIYGVHYYPSTRKLADLKSDLAKIEDIPFWSTESHWNNIDGQDQLLKAEISMTTIWDQTDQGLDGLCMWDFQGNEDNFRFNMVKEAMVPLKDAQPIFTDDMDGTTIDSSYYGERLFTRSFIEDSLVHVYAINMTENDIENQIFSINYSLIEGEISYVQFTDDSPVTGYQGTAIKSGTDKMFMMDLPSRSVTHLSFLITPIDILKYECEDLDYSSPTSTTIEVQTNNNADGGKHVNLAATGLGESIVFDLEVPSDGDYRLMLTGLTWLTFGQYTCEVKQPDGSWYALDGNIDLYNTQSGRASMTWESVPLTSGTQQLRFSASEEGLGSGYKGSFDYLVLEKMSTTSIEESEVSTELRIFPNPVAEQLSVEGLAPDQELLIYSLGGQVLLKTSEQDIDVSQLTPGIYLLKADQKVFRFVKK